MHHIGRWNVPQLRHAFLPAPFPFEMISASISSRERGLWVSTVDSSSVLHECGKRSRGFMSSSCAEAIYPRSTWWSPFNEEPLFFTSVKSYAEASCPRASEWTRRIEEWRHAVLRVLEAPHHASKLVSNGLSFPLRILFRGARILFQRPGPYVWVQNRRYRCTPGRASTQ